VPQHQVQVQTTDVVGFIVPHDTL